MRFVLLILFMVVFTKGFGYDPRPGAPVDFATLDKKLILQLINEVRSRGCQCGDTFYYQAPPLKWNDKLEKAAVQHSRDMREKNYFSHIAPDGSRADKRLDRIGYPWTTYGENIAQGYASEKQVVEGWLSSPGHCRNIMNKQFRETGVGRSGLYWTQTFGSSK